MKYQNEDNRIIISVLVVYWLKKKHETEVNENTVIIFDFTCKIWKSTWNNDFNKIQTKNKATLKQKELITPWPQQIFIYLSVKRTLKTTS